MKSLITLLAVEGEKCLSFPTILVIWIKIFVAATENAANLSLILTVGYCTTGLQGGGSHPRLPDRWLESPWQPCDLIFQALST